MTNIKIKNTVDESISFYRTVLIHFLSEMENSGISYAVLRNYSGFPHFIPKPDISLLLNDTQTNKFISLSRKAAKQLQCFCFVVPAKVNMISVYFIENLENKNSNDEPRVLKFDVRHYQNYPGVFLKNRVALKNLKTKKIIKEGLKFTVLNEVDELVLMLKQWQRKQSEAYRKNIEELLNEEGVRKWLEFEANLSTDSIKKNLNSGDKKSYEQYILRLFILRFGKNTITNLTRSQSLALKTSIRNFALRPRALIYLSGPDGSGKTTVANYIVSFCRANKIHLKTFYTLNQLLRVSVLFLKWNIQRFILRELTGISFRHYKTNLAGHKDRDDGSKLWKFKKKLFLLLALVDIVPGYMRVNLYRLFGYTVMIETSPYDLFTKWQMPRFNFAENYLAPLIPKPNLGLIMWGNPEKINQRKNELTTQEIQDYYNRMNGLINSIKNINYIKLNTDQNIGSTFSTVIKLLEGTFE